MATSPMSGTPGFLTQVASGMAGQAAGGMGVKQQPKKATEPRASAPSPYGGPSTGAIMDV